jgi:hypothetical protein
MASPAEIAIEKFIRAWSEPDGAVRAALLEECFAEHGRMVTGAREIRGRAALAADMARFHATGQLARIRLTSAIEVRGATFRYRGAAELRDGTIAEAFDAGELDDTGKIALVLTFAGPLPELEVPRVFGAG